jgi:alcohol dehydrogenase (cytochrome c)
MKLFQRPARILLALALVAVLIVAAASLASPAVAWRVKLVGLKLSGKIPEIPLTTLVRWMPPRSPVNLYHLAEVPHVDVSITNPFTDRDSAAAGSRTFGHTCASCHGDDARGRTGPDLLAAITRLSDWKFLATVKWGRPGTLMVGQPLSEREIWEVGAFLRQDALYAAIGKKDSVGGSAAYQTVSAAMLLRGNGSGDWLQYAGDYSGHRHSDKTQINRQNVANLRLAWAAQLPSDGTFEESSPIVVGDRVFVTEPPEGVTALDARTGAVLWQFHRAVPAGIPNCCGGPNKGVAVLGANVYVGTFDAHLLALDAATGRQVWDTQVADWREGFTITAAPLAIDDRIVIGLAGGDFGTRGFLAAYAAADGKQQWKFYTIPGPGEPGNDTWGGDSWQHGGASTWVTGAYDPALGLIYWGTGNPDPVFNPQRRPGANLYTCSMIALDAATGRLRWYYQFTPGDDHGWDSTEQPVLADILWEGQSTPALLLANRNGFFYALDRRSGRFLYAKAFAKQTWASGFTADGHPIIRSDAHATANGNVASPASNGATSWWPPSFDPKRNLMFVPAVDSADTYYNIDEKYHQGRPFLSSGFVRDHNQPTTLAIRAVDTASGQVRWDSTLAVGGGDVPGEMGGVLSTGGDLVFAGHEQVFEAYDADTGARVWGTPLGGVIHAAPISFSSANQQYVAIIAGRTLFAFSLPADPKDGAGAPAAAPARARRAGPAH